MYCNENYTYGDLQPENFYEDEPIISLGNIRIETVPTPGHTLVQHLSSLKSAITFMVN